MGADADSHSQTLGGVQEVLQRRKKDWRSQRSREIMRTQLTESTDQDSRGLAEIREPAEV